MVDNLELLKKEHLILHIEDNLGDFLLLKESLESYTFSGTLKNINDGQDALDFIFNNSFSEPSVFIIDINLPRIDGLTILKNIKQSEKYKHVPVIIFSSSDSEHDIQNTYNLGADLYLIKPMDWEDYKKIAESIIKFLD
jgi:CheY-like chemotaxis protein